MKVLAVLFALLAATSWAASVAKSEVRWVVTGHHRGKVLVNGKKYGDWFDTANFKFIVRYKRGGETTYSAHARVPSAIFSYGGAYYDPEDGNSLVDFVLINGSLKHEYLLRKRTRRGSRLISRPVLIFDPKPRIIRKAGNDWRKLVLPGMYAIAGDRSCRDYNRLTWRQVVGLKNGRICFFTIYGTEARCHKLMKQVGIREKDYIFFDGGSAVGPDKKVPTHIVVATKDT